MPLEADELLALEELLELFELELEELPLVLLVLLLPELVLLLAEGVGLGVAVTRNDCALVAVPAALVTVIGPLVAPLGTIAFSCVSLCTWKNAVSPLKLTEVVPSKPAPTRVTVVSTGPLGGVKLVSVGEAVAVGVGDEEVLTALRRMAGLATTALPVPIAAPAPESAAVVVAALPLLVLLALAVPLSEIVRALRHRPA